MRILSLLFIFLTCSIVSQNPQLQWAKCVQGNISIGKAVTNDAYGNVYVAGYFVGVLDFDPGPGTFTLSSNGYEDLFVCKLSPSGNLIWAKSVGGLAPDKIYSISLDAAGNIYTTGEFGGPVDFDPGAGVFNLNSVCTDLFIWKLDPFGNFVWAKSASCVAAGGSGEIASCIKLDLAGNIFITGHFDDTVDFDPGPASYTVSSVTQIPWDIFILKLDPLGNFIWVKTLGGTTSEYARSITFDSANNILISGEFIGTTDFDPGPGTYTLSSTSISNSDIYVLKLDPLGNFVWAKSLTGTGYEKVKSIVTDAANNIYFAGGFNGSNDFDPGPLVYSVTSAFPSFDDMYVTKFDALGNFVWVKTAGTFSPEIVNQVVIDPAGDLCMVGEFATGTDFDPGSGFSPLYGNVVSSMGFIWKLDTAGNYIWAGNIEGTPYSINVDAVGNIYTTGAFNYTLDFDPGPSIYNMTAVGGVAMFALKLGNCSAVSGSVTSQNVTCTGVNDGYININMIGAPPFSYIWTPVNTNSATLTGLTAGTYSCIVTNSCYSSFEQTVTLISLYADPTVTAVSNTNAICPGSTVTITASGANTYSWSTGATSSSITVTPTSSIIYTVTGKNAMGCSNSATQSISINPLPGLMIISTASIICSGNSVTIIAGGANTFTWSNGSNGNVITVTPTLSTTYTLVGMSGDGCIDSTTFTQNVSICTEFENNFNNSGLEITIYPNPNNGHFYIKEFENNIGKDVEIYNSAGQLIRIFKIENTIQKINLSEYANGFYFIKITDNNLILKTSKIFKN